MAEIINPADVLIDIDVTELLPKVMEFKTNGYRISQACAAYINEKYELSYSFTDLNTYEFITLRVVIDVDTEVPSISEIIPAAVFYENEMKELFGVKIKMINLDYDNKLYRINAKAPLGPKEGN
ncbi:MAG TPA: hypothetical protein DCM49_03385 [Lachnospiraceae bacterium]|nr:hypothetical protein [Lachnospiraceae bacterium]